MNKYDTDIVSIVETKIYLFYFNFIKTIYRHIHQIKQLNKIILSSYTTSS